MIGGLGMHGDRNYPLRHHHHHHREQEQEQDEFKKRNQAFLEIVFNSIQPIIEREVEREVERRLEWHLGQSWERRMTSLRDSQEAAPPASTKESYEALLSKYEALKREMQRSRELFEEKCKECKITKETLSQKDLPCKLSSSTIDNLTTQSLASINGKEEVGESTIFFNDDRSKATKTSPSQFDSIKKSPPSSPEPLLCLLTNVFTPNNNMNTLQSNGSETIPKEDKAKPVRDSMVTDSDDDDNDNVNQDDLLGSSSSLKLARKSPHSNHPLKVLGSAKRTSPTFVDTLRSKMDRRQAHARDCTCCSKVVSLLLDLYYG